MNYRVFHLWVKPKLSKIRKKSSINAIIGFQIFFEIIFEILSPKTVTHKKKQKGLSWEGILSRLLLIKFNSEDMERKTEGNEENKCLTQSKIRKSCNFPLIFPWCSFYDFLFFFSRKPCSFYHFCCCRANTKVYWVSGSHE